MTRIISRENIPFFLQARPNDIQLIKSNTHTLALVSGKCNREKRNLRNRKTN